MEPGSSLPHWQMPPSDANLSQNNTVHVSPNDPTLSHNNTVHVSPTDPILSHNNTVHVSLHDPIQATTIQAMPPHLNLP